MSDREFRDTVIAGLARLEAKMASVEDRTERQSTDLANVVRFQNRVLGAMSVLSIAGSAVISFGVSLIKQRSSGQQ